MPRPLFEAEPRNLADIVSRAPSCLTPPLELPVRFLFARERLFLSLCVSKMCFSRVNDNVVSRVSVPT